MVNYIFTVSALLLYNTILSASVFNNGHKIHRSSCRKDALFKLTDRNKKLQGQASNVIGSSRVKSLPLCVKLCMQPPNCRSINYKSEPGSNTEKNCQLLDIDKSNSTAQLTEAAGWKHYEPVSQVIVEHLEHMHFSGSTFLAGLWK